MNISLLPPELIEEVAKYLPLEDVVSCSMVSKQLNKAFDNDRIWNKYCTFPKTYFNKQITKRTSSTKHFFGYSKSKEHVYRELEVEKNLVKGKYALTLVNVGGWYCDNLVDVVDDEGNHLLFISCSPNDSFVVNWHKIDVWNMNNEEPVKLESKETPLKGLPRLLDSQIKVFKNKLYYMVENVCIVFEFSPPEYKLTFIFQVTCPEFMSNTTMVCKPDIVLGFCYSINFPWAAEPLVHVWGENSSLLYKNYSTNEVDRRQAMMHGTRSILAVKDDGNSDNVLVVFKSVSGGASTMSVLLFNVKTFQYTTLFVKTKLKNYVSCELVNEIVVLFYHQLAEDMPIGYVPKLICCNTDGDLIYNTELFVGPDLVPMNVITANNGREVLILDSLRNVTVLDVFEKTVISTFNLRRHRGQCIVNFIKDNLIIVEELEKEKTVVAVWDFKRGERLYDLIKLQSHFPTEDIYRFSFMKSFRSPSKIFAIKEPNCFYARCCEGEIVMISFV